MADVAQIARKIKKDVQNGIINVPAIVSILSMVESKPKKETKKVINNLEERLTRRFK